MKNTDPGHSVWGPRLSWLRCSGQPRAVLPLCSPHPLCSSCPLDLQQQNDTPSVAVKEARSASSPSDPPPQVHAVNLLCSFTSLAYLFASIPCKTCPPTHLCILRAHMHNKCSIFCLCEMIAQFEPWAWRCHAIFELTSQGIAVGILRPRAH